MVEEDNLHFVISEYFATGEGMTISLLITRAYPKEDDYDEDSRGKSYMGEDGTFHFVMPTLKEGNTARYRAMREFVELFGNWYGRGAEVLSRHEFLSKFSRQLPDHVVRLLTDTEDDSGNFKYHSQYHVNYS